MCSHFKAFESDLTIYDASLWLASKGSVLLIVSGRTPAELLPAAAPVTPVAPVATEAVAAASANQNKSTASHEPFFL